MTESATLLLVEDDANDTAFFKRAFAKIFPQINLDHVEDATGAMHYLHGTGPFKERKHFPHPYAVVVDLTLPGVSGTHLVKWMPLQPKLGKMLVAAWTGSHNSQDIARLYRYGANSFLKKTDLPAQLEN